MTAHVSVRVVVRALGAGRRASARGAVRRLAARATCAVAIAAMAPVLVAAPAFAGNVTLGSGQRLSSGQSLKTGSSCYDLDVQATDGNIVEYCGQSAVWSTNTGGHAGDYLIVQASDGNVVAYTSGNSPLWSTGTSGYSGDILKLQTDGNLVVYKGTTPLWARSWIQSPSDAQTYAPELFQGYSWSVSSQKGCLTDLWNQESGWEWNATNPSSGAYGIPQALPASKLASKGTDWKTDGLTQVQWGLSYIKSTYGNPCGAWSHEQTYGWY
ncbi:hypothetical protein GHK86_11970 [Acidimicrobiaceae bacterium USS-CC1]|uniref:Bulb-type lectin domain-containing protein n=1 Tax=Acidiferrimicrobium australe TaxID=2664430 RepID=A0ABW9QVW9_9ACTN|nr:hypothetical protein [Acidiferrimicrobium australe]